ncbi:unnamed protein product [Musa hybrid cultivar]
MRKRTASWIVLTYLKRRLPIQKQRTISCWNHKEQPRKRMLKQAIARKETAQLKDMFSDKENYLQRLKQDHEGLKVSEAAATGSVRVLKRFLAATSTLDSSKVENESISDSIVSEAGKVVTKFSLERWSGRRHSIGEPGKLKGPSAEDAVKRRSKRELFGDLEIC